MTGQSRGRGLRCAQRLGILYGVRDSRSRSYAIISPGDRQHDRFDFAASLSRPRTILQTQKSVVEARIGQQGRHLAGRRIRSQNAPRLEGVHANLIFGIHANELVGAELEEFGRCLARECEDDQHPLLAKDIDLAAPELRITRPNGNKRLDWIVCDGADTGIYAAAGELDRCQGGELEVVRVVVQRLTSSRVKESGSRPSERSFWMPDCLPLKN